MASRTTHSITAHCIVKNEEYFIDAAILSVIEYVEKVLVYDTGSNDSTIHRIDELIKKYPGKIILREKGECPKEKHAQLRQEMLDETTTDWFMILDGDEVYTNRAMEEAVKNIRENAQAEWFVSPYYLCVGDIYHTYYKEKYDPFYDRVGFFTPRFIKKIPGLHWRGDYELDTLYKQDGSLLFTKEHILFLNERYWHVTHLRRSRYDDKVYTSGIEKIRSRKRRLTYIGIGKKIRESVPEVFISTEHAKGVSLVGAFIEFVKLTTLNPRLFVRKINFLYMFEKLVQFIKAKYIYYTKSYAQEGEDILLDRYLGHKESGTFVDVGAHHPKRFSNSFMFYRRGWNGINIDATPGSMRLFNKVRSRDINVEAAVSDEKTTMTFYMFNEPALNTFSKELSDAYVKSGYTMVDKKSMQTKTLAEILDQHHTQNIDFLSIDVEGFEIHVLKSNNWSKYRPRIIVVEGLNFNLQNPAESDVYVFLTQLGYVLDAKTFNSLFFIST